MKLFFVFISFVFAGWFSASAQSVRKVENFDSTWKFMLGDDSLAKKQHI